jgi:SAM-dependent methyltransferase
MTEIKEGVLKAYSAAAEKPADKHPFPVGRQFAKSIGYPEDLLDGLPANAIDAFTGVSNISIFADMPTGSTVLDVGCGAGLDSLISARRVGSSGRVIGIDFSDAMVSRAQRAAVEVNRKNIEFLVAMAENLPVEDRSVDIVLVNGIFNLSPSRDVVFRELARVVREGGEVYAAELILKAPLPADTVCDINSWFA